MKDFQSLLKRKVQLKQQQKKQNGTKTQDNNNKHDFNSHLEVEEENTQAALTSTHSNNNNGDSVIISNGGSNNNNNNGGGGGGDSYTGSGDSVNMKKKKKSKKRNNSITDSKNGDSTSSSSSSDNTQRGQLILVAGCYEKALFGYSVDVVSDAEGTSSFKLELQFNNVAHEGCVKDLSTRGRWLLSASTDETIKIFDLLKRIEFGSLLQHIGAVTCLQFHESNFLSGGDDGIVCVWRIKDWECLLTLTGHTSPVLSLSIHPSGKLAVSISKDGTLKLWNLIKGKCSFTTTINKEAEKVLWSPSGNYYALVVGSSVEVYSSSGTKISTLAHPKRVIAMTFLRENIIVSGGEGNSLSLWDVEKISLLSTWVAHTNRVKAIITISELPNIIASASSDGYIKLWDVSNLEKAVLKAEVDTTARLTALTYTRVPYVAEIAQPVVEDAKKRRRVQFME